MSNISQLANVPDISFIENMSLEETEQQVIDTYLRLYQELTGKEAELGDADTKKLLIKAFSLIIYQVMQYIDAKGKAELLKSSTGDALEGLAALLGITRNGSGKAIAVERFTLSAERPDVIAVPAGTRVKTQNGHYFNTTEYAEIAAGDMYVDVPIQAEEAGTASNDLIAGVINTLVDPIAYVAKVENVTKSTGGTDTENDDSLTERVYLAPSKFSVAGPIGAYEYFIREWRSDVGDVKVVSPTPCVVVLYVVLNDGRVLTDAEKTSLLEYISDDYIRPLTDHVQCGTPEEIDYTIDVTYYIARSDSMNANNIKEAVEATVEEYKLWQRKLGRDINPTELVYRIREAGAKRVSLTAPTDVVITDIQLPNCTDTNLAYGGLEDD